MADSAPALADAQAGQVILGVPRETMENERRVALIPDAVKKYAGAGHTVLVQSGAGVEAAFTDDAYAAAGATIVPDAGSVFSGADLILKVHRPQDSELPMLKPGSALIAFLQPLVNTDLVAELARRKITAFSMDAIPRTTRAQTMDALSSMSTIGGYKAVLLAANNMPKLFPMLMTAAGTIAPAKVLIIGAGVAGLQAIATARRLGAVVEAYDTRPVVREQVESLGAKFVEVDMTGIEAQTQDAGGYARESSPELLQRQQETLANRAMRSDVIITTALVPGRPAPKLISEETVRQMPPGAVIVDMAAEAGGNCELTVPGEIVQRHGVTIIGLLNLPGMLPFHSSQMYSKNIQNLLALLIAADGVFHVNFDDDIVAGTCITMNGEVAHAATRERMLAAAGATT
ncbi:MAG TPA: Re/Si-specific NAD(P)(+) transhydrogenase subunit alpha [Thermomicrobiales bacterium]|nr:Re/Si-specific NAD(P)(+) transhydrogenase subunit alpha [Thermomicrobiales bacterium]